MGEREKGGVNNKKHMIQYDRVYDLISWVRIKVADDELDAEQALDMLEREINEIEHDD